TQSVKLGVIAVLASLITPLSAAVGAESDASIDLARTRASAISNNGFYSLGRNPRAVASAPADDQVPYFDANVTAPFFYNSNSAQTSPASGPTWEFNPTLQADGGYQFLSPSCHLCALRLSASVSAGVDRYAPHSTVDADDAKGSIKATFNDGSDDQAFMPF